MVNDDITSIDIFGYVLFSAAVTAGIVLAVYAVVLLLEVVI
jgi:hypothetical protein